MNTTTIKGITYNILAEGPIAEYENIVANNNANVVSILFLVRPRGHKKFWATRDVNGEVTLN